MIKKSSLFSAAETLAGEALGLGGAWALVLVCAAGASALMGTVNFKVSITVLIP